VTCTIRAQRGNERRDITCRPGQSLYSALLSGGMPPLASCGGNATCGKCLVRAHGALSPVTGREKDALTPAQLAGGWRLACQAEARGDVQVFVPDAQQGAHIAQDSALKFSGALTPLVRRVAARVPAPSLCDQRDDLTRLMSALGLPKAAPIEAVRRLPDILRRSEGEVCAYLCADAPTGVSPMRTGAGYGVAVDIGTTTVVCYLIDLGGGATLDVLSALNAQRPWGDDVITRMDAVIVREDGLSLLHRAITGQINDMIKALLARNAAAPEDILCVCAVGNTVMLHLFARADPRNIAAAPFIPAFSDALIIGPDKLGLSLPGYCRVLLAPSIAGYVGADITAGILACGLYQSDRPCLLIDLGTNGELALGDKTGILCCATAAGPAFEGASISCGMGGVAGAVNRVLFDGNDFIFDTLGGGKPAGLCGSGILDAVRALLEAGVIDESGHFVAGHAFESRMTAHRGAAAFTLVPAQRGRDGRDIALSRRDISQIQLAKAAVAAGIKALLRERRLTPGDVDAVYIAGGFGSFMDVKSAAAIGLIPPQLESRVKILGNAAGAGAIAALLSERVRADFDIIKRMSRTLELSGLPDFQNDLVDAMFFE